MQLAGFEWQKIFSGKIKWILLAFFFLNLGAYYIYMIPYLPTTQERGIRQRWERELSGRETDIEGTLKFLLQEQEKGKVQNLMEKPDEREIAERRILGAICQEYTAITEYHSFIDGMRKRAEDMQQISIFNKKGSFSQRNIEKTVKDFERVEGLVLHPMDDTGMRVLHNFYLTDILLVLLVCLFCFQGYGRDFKSGMANLIQVTPRGKGWLRLAQAEAAALSVLVSGVLLYGTNLILTGVFFGFGNPSYYIQGMAMFRNVSFPCTIGTYLFLYFLWKLLALVFISLVFQFFAVWFGGQNMAWFCSGAVLVLSFTLWFFLPDSPSAKLFRYLNLIGLLDVKQIIGNYQNLKVSAYPVGLLTGAAVFMAVLGSILLAGILLVNQTEKGSFHLEFPAWKHTRVWKRTFSYECYKILVNQRVWCIFAVLAVLSVWMVKPGAVHVTRIDFNYEHYMREYEGAYTRERAAEIASLWEKQDFYDYEGQQGFQRLYEQSRYLKETESGNKGIVNVRILQDFFFSEQKEFQNTLFIVLAVLLSVSGLFYQDRKKQMEKLLCTTPKSRKIYWDKMKLAALFGGVASLMVWSVFYIRYFYRNDIPGLSYSIRSIPGFAEMGYDGSILSYMMIALLLRMITGVYIGILLGFLAQLLTAPTQNIICGVLLLVLPLCLSYIGEMGYENSLIFFIQRYLAPALKPVKFLAAFPSRWFRAGMEKMAVFSALPLLCLWTGCRLWERKE